MTDARRLKARIGALSDTHLREPDSKLDHILETVLSGAGIILHAGDIVTRRVLDHLAGYGVVAVCGNMDDYEVAGSIPVMRVIPAADKRIGLIHGWGSKDGLEERILDRFEEPKPDIIVYGHTHRPFWGKIDGVWMFNPGSASTAGNRGGGTVGMIEIYDDGIEARHISVE